MHPADILPWFSTVVRRTPPVDTGLTAPLTSQRTRVRLDPQEAPDSPKQGTIPCRPAMMPIVFWEHDQTLVAEGEFVAVQQYDRELRAGIIHGYQTPQYERANTRVPSHVAYGSLFVQG